uniref:Uncharacterized protein n=1 Tax=Candidatus Kentrum sp. TC TaxID=2126339 RepID=A0A450YNZ2_9GAMM|nr:MAG: hypothetical protein BECKTC1821E_GA0114239_102414 [Candidatus Kentron sp. TC]VFK43650.1 MAG: hypothetical protein BECKTC1821D_GA0114238_101726 [Candidatus Kentron sp. TC]
MGVLRAQLEPRLFLDTVRYCKERLLRLSSGFAKNDEIVRIADESIAKRVD